MVQSLSMKNKHVSENPDTGGDEPLNLLDVFKAAFRHEGIEFESVTFLRWQVVDDTILPLPIDTMSALFRELRDGKYQLTINEVKISASGKAPLETHWICAEIAYSNGQWLEPAIFHDEGTYDLADHETAQTLDARLRGAKTNLKTALDWVVTIMHIAEAIRRIYGGS